MQIGTTGFGTEEEVGSANSSEQFGISERAAFTNRK